MLFQISPGSALDVEVIGWSPQIQISFFVFIIITVACLFNITMQHVLHCNTNCDLLLFVFYVRRRPCKKFHNVYGHWKEFLLTSERKTLVTFHRTYKAYTRRNIPFMRFLCVKKHFRHSLFHVVDAITLFPLTDKWWQGYLPTLEWWSEIGQQTRFQQKEIKYWKKYKKVDMWFRFAYRALQNAIYVTMLFLPSCTT